MIQARWWKSDKNASKSNKAHEFLKISSNDFLLKEGLNSWAGIGIGMI